MAKGLFCFICNFMFEIPLEEARWRRRRKKEKKIKEEETGEDKGSLH